MGTPKTDEELGSGLLSILETRYGVARTTLEKIGAFVVMWATFENYLEQALWRLTDEDPHGVFPTTDAKPVSVLIERFREVGLKLDGDDWESIVRHCQTNLSRPAKGAGLRLSGRQLTPLGQGGGTVLSEDVAAIEVSVLIEMIMDRGVDGGEFLQGLYVPELRHRTLSSSERLM